MYQLTITEKQAEVIQRALEFYGRVSMGQLDEVEFVCPIDQLQADKTLGRSALETAKFAFTGLRNGAYIGVSGVNDNAKIAWDIHQVIRHRISWDRNPEGGWTTNYDEPMHYSNTEKLPIMKKAE